MKWLLWHVHVHFDCAGSHKTVVLLRSSCGDPDVVLSKRFLRDLVKALVRRPCGDPAGLLSERSRHDLAQLLMRWSCRDPGEILSCTGPSEKILWTSCWNHLQKRSLHDLVQVLLRRSCWDPSEVLPCCEKIWVLAWRSFSRSFTISRANTLCRS